jgi:protein O-GlcNAc transferase
LKAGRNDPCPCGSGKKFKKCCGQESAAANVNKSSNSDALIAADSQQLVTLYQEGRFAELENKAHKLLERQPTSGFIWKVLGLALTMQGKDAQSALERAAQFLPEDAEVHCYLGNVLSDLGQHQKAIISYRRAIEINRNFAEPHYNLGNTQKNLNQFEEAILSYKGAVAINPNFAQAHNNLGIVQRDLNQLHDAIKSYRRALEINPNYGDAHFNLGNALKDLGEYQNAVASYRRALEIKPNYADAYSNLGNALLGLGKIHDAIASYDAALQINPDLTSSHSNLLFAQNYLSPQSHATLLSDAKRFGEMVARRAHPYTNWANRPNATRCLRVGFVSGDLREHPVGYFVECVLAAIASDMSDRLEIAAYLTNSYHDTLTERVKNYCHTWRSAVDLSDEDLARQIRDDNIDILIDLSGHTAHNRLAMFAWKPAPVQVSWLGYFATTGVAAIDYLIADPWTLPLTEESHFTETIWRLPETRLCFTPPDIHAEISPLPFLKNNFVTFGCFNNLTKMNDAVVALWAKILIATPTSRLFLKAESLNSTLAQHEIMRRFAAHDIGADRLILEGPSPRSAYVSEYNRVDIALDPFPFPGGATSAEALWMGVPVLTLAGDRFISRQGNGILINAGLSDWIATNPDDYVARAVRHAGNPRYLSVLRKDLRQQVLNSPIFDAPRFVRHFESALRGMWTQWCGQRLNL